MGVDGKEKGEGRTLALLGGGAALAAGVGHHVADDGEAAARAAGLPAAGTVDAIEALEDALEVARRNPHAVVLDGELYPAAVIAGADLYLLVVVGVLHGVVEEVVDGGHQLAAIAVHRHLGRDQADLEMDLATV